MGQMHPHSGLTDREERVLLDAGWCETLFESLPPPWTDGREATLYTPREAYAECVRRLKATRGEADDAPR